MGKLKPYCLLGLFLIAIWVVKPSSQAYAAGTVGTAGVEIVTPVSIVANPPPDSLSFGTFASASGGSITLKADGTAGSNPGVVFVLGGNPSRGGFTLGGQPNLAYSLAGSDTEVIITRVGGGSLTATLEYFSEGKNAIVFPSPGVLDGGVMKPDGTDQLRTGGVLIVPLGALPGSYAGQYTVVLNH